MDILQIRGENIASLARPFDIRLDAPPLSGAGLFAITGPTGSGKSSLLDAMCLALYGDCPRLGSAGVNDTVPDVSGEMLQSSDARTILRRGAASGYAAVRFRARDGNEYEAMWAVRRAYGKASAKLQAVDRSITRLSDAAVLENQTRAVTERIAALTGLTYDEFRRSVLLAQGDFDSFLSARTSERAAILEKVTGTQLYRDISRRVFAAHAAAERGVQDLEVQLGEHSALSPEERAIVEGDLAALGSERKDAGAALAATRADIARHKSVEEARAQHLAATEALARASEAAAARQGDVAQMAQLQKAAKIRGEYRDMQSAEAAEAEARRALAGNAEALGRAEAALGTAEADLAARREAHDRIEDRFKELGQVWDRAAALDVELRAAGAEEDAARTALHTRKAQADAADKALATARADHGALERQIAELAGTLAADPEGAALLKGWQVLSDRLERRIAACTAMALAQSEKTRLETALEGADRQKAGISARMDSARAKTHRLEQEAAARAPRRDALRAAGPAQRLTRLARSAASVRTCAALSRQHAGETDQANAYLRGQQQARSAIAESEAAGAEAAQARARAEAQADALAAPARLAEAAASSEAAALRVHLEDGQPCPVCHATHHPVLDDDRTRALSDDLRRRLDAARSAHRDAVTAGEAAEARRVQANADLERLGARLAASAQTLDEIGRDYAAAVQTEDEGPLAGRLPAGPAEAAPVLAQLLESLAEWQGALEADLSELEALDRAAQDGDAQMSALAGDMRAAQEEDSRIEAQSRDMRRTLDTRTAGIAAHQETLRDLDTALARDFADLALDWRIFDAGGAAPLEELAARKDAYARASERRDALAEQMHAAAREVERCDAAQRSEADAARSLTDAWHARRDATAALKARRALLLDGEDTSGHRTAFNQRRKAAQDAKDSAAEARGSAASALSGAVAASKAAEDTHAAATARLKAAGTALEAALSRTGLAAGTAQTLLGWSVERTEALALAIKRAGDALAQAQQLADTRQSDLARLEQAGLPDAPVADLTSALARLEAEDAQRLEAMAGLRNRLKSDAEARARMADIVARINAAKTECDTLGAVNTAVGSASGDRFSTIAQEVTLSILVEQANHHLRDVKPRYRLARGAGKLSLHVVDEDMAGEIRSTRSLSGGERFLVSLALALALGAVGGTGLMSGTLFIDEGFGTLDAASLDMAIDVLETLQAQGRMIGVISHVQAMQDRIPVQIAVRARGAGASEVVLRGDAPLPVSANDPQP